MSSSKPESHIALTEEPKEAGKKIMKAITGGRQSLAEQKKLGGDPEKCSIYEFLVFHLSDDDKELLELDAECRSGRRMCGTCKKDVAERIQRFLTEHQKAREAARERRYFTISQTFSSATATPVSASISTPVFPSDVTVTVALTRSCSSSKFTSSAVMGMGWHNRINRGVSFTARIAASLAVVRTSPFFTCPDFMASIVDSLSRMEPEVVAVRCIGGFSVMSTIPTSFFSSIKAS